MKTTKKFLSLVLTVMFISLAPIISTAAETQLYCVECNGVTTAIEGRTVSPTCENAGYTELICKNCSSVLGWTNQIRPNGHIVKILDGVEATCTTEGYMIKVYCEICHRILEYEEPFILKAKGHSFIEIVLEATCSSNGEKIKKCTVCGYSELIATIPPIDHLLDESTIKTIAPTCTNAGMSTGICTMCSCEISKIIPALGHNFKLVKSYKAPTCKNAGNYDENYCSRCKETFYFDANGNSVSAQYVALNPLNALGHIDNNVDYTCDRCYALLEMPEPELPEYEFENGYYYTLEQGSATIYGVDLETKGKIVIPSTLGGYPVTAIGEYAFSECFWLTDVVIPETVKFIGEGAFAYCIALKEIVIPESVTSIGDYAFICCMSLERIIFKNSSTDIGDYVGYTDALVKEGHTLEEWLNKFYKIADAELNGGADDALYEDILAITILCEDIVVNPILNIYGYESSTARTFAIANGMPFKNIDEYFKNDLDISTGVEVVYPTDAFNEEVDFVVKQNGANANIVLGSIFTKYKSYDISFESEGLKVQPNGKVTVKLPIPEGYNIAFVYAYYIDDVGSKTKLDSRVENGFIIFETDHFSEYVIVDESSKIDSPDKPAEPCPCNCHAGGIKAFFFKLINFFAKLFNPAKRVCACGVKH